MLDLIGDFYGLTGAILGIFAGPWLARQLKLRKKLPVPAGSTPTIIDRHLSNNYFNILSFFLIGAGFAYLLAGDLGISSSSVYLLMASTLLMISILGLGFTSYITKGTSGSMPYQTRWTVWHGRSSVIFFMILTIVSAILPFFTTGLEMTGNWTPSIIQGIFGFAAIAYIMRKSNFEDTE